MRVFGCCGCGWYSYGCVWGLELEYCVGVKVDWLELKEICYFELWLFELFE